MTWCNRNKTTHLKSRFEKKVKTESNQTFRSNTHLWEIRGIEGGKLQYSHKGPNKPNPECRRVECSQNGWPGPCSKPKTYIYLHFWKCVCVYVCVCICIYIYIFLMEGLLGNIRDDCGFLSYTLKSPQDVK